MERPRNQPPDPAQMGNLGVTIDSLEKDPEIYYHWMITTLETGFADRDVEAMVDILGKLDDMISGREGLSPQAWPAEARLDIQSAVQKMRAEIESRTSNTVAELSLAREVYKDRLPDMFVKTTDSDEWQLVEGFAVGRYHEIYPIINGQPYMDFVMEVQQDIVEKY